MSNRGPATMAVWIPRKAGDVRAPPPTLASRSQVSASTPSPLVFAVDEVRPGAFLQWRSRLSGSAKTIKAHQVSAYSFLNWLVKTERLLANPLAKID